MAGQAPRDRAIGMLRFPRAGYARRTAQLNRGDPAAPSRAVESPVVALDVLPAKPAATGFLAGTVPTSDRVSLPQLLGGTSSPRGAIG